MATLVENSYGIVKRFDYVDRVINDLKPVSILDFGCGTGELLTVPLVEKYPDISFTAADDDKASIEFGRAKNEELKNLRFVYPKDLAESDTFDLIIASEVIEHVDEPGDLLAFLRHRLNGDGRLVLTLPNGYGPFEVTSFSEALLFIAGIDAGKIYRRITKKDLGSEGKYSLAVSPHINFFSMRDIRRVIEQSGFEIVDYTPRTFLCGMGFDQVLRGKFLNSMNDRVTNILPASFVSDWMFELIKTERSKEATGYRRNRYARFRRRLNEKRWGIGDFKQDGQDRQDGDPGV
jgi:SAM-dependent methyltransferase